MCPRGLEGLHGLLPARHGRLHTLPPLRGGSVNCPANRDLLLSVQVRIYFTRIPVRMRMSTAGTQLGTGNQSRGDQSYTVFIIEI